MLDQDSLVGTDILGLISTGIHTNPLTLYREYIQNAADAIERFASCKEGRVDIFVDAASRGLTIRDNGPGLSLQQAKDALIPVARSDKRAVSNRGFRGFGRLSGLACCQSVVFVTRNKADAPATQLTWNGKKMRKCITERLALEETISECVRIERLKAENMPEHFFEVRVEGVHRHTAALVLNVNAVRDYIGEVCPVPFSAEFPYKQHISEVFEHRQLPLELDIYLHQGESRHVELDAAKHLNRLHGAHAPLSAERKDDFIEFEKIEIPALSGEAFAAVGWIAHTSYLGALHLRSQVRSLRARVGNIQIGDETAFDHLFSETRFNRWCVGEIHILDPRIIPNGARDYFETNVHLRNLENHLIVLCREIEQKCRAASKRRNLSKKYQAFLEDIKATHDLVTSGYLSAPAAEQLVREKLANTAAFKQERLLDDADKKTSQLSELEQRILNEIKTYKLAPGKLAGFPEQQAAAYRDVFNAIAKMSTSSLQAKETIEAILKFMEIENYH